MNDQDGLGALARRWLQAKKIELLTGNKREREDATANAEEAERRAGEGAVTDLTHAMFPGLRQMEEQRDAAERQRHAEEQARIIALPRAAVRLSASGSRPLQWEGELPVRTSLSDGVFTVELIAPEGAEPDVAGRPLHGASIAIAEWRGAGRYELAPAVQRAEASGVYLEADRWYVAVGLDDETLYWVPDLGPAEAAVADGAHALSFRAHMSGAAGEGDVVLDISNLPGG